MVVRLLNGTGRGIAVGILSFLFLPLIQIDNVTSFSVAPITRIPSAHRYVHKGIYHPQPQPLWLPPKRNILHLSLFANNDENEEEDPMAVWKEAYPDLEFVDYSDPEYKVDQGGDESLALTGEETEDRIEEMREERRRKNDEFQFETYYRDVLKMGAEFKGEWTVFKAIFSDTNNLPELKKAKHTIKVISKGERVITDPEASWRVDGEHIVHKDVAAPENEESAFTFASDILSQTCWPKELKASDFRGPAGIMKVGNAHTICQTIAKNRNNDGNDGPFMEMRTEVGIHNEDIRFRFKLCYKACEKDLADSTPPLLLDSVIICRERSLVWPRKEGYAPSEKEIALFGPPGANGGLYDPPPVGSDEQAEQYMMLDLQGGATVLFPYKMDQNEGVFEDNGWVTTLDWSPGDIRYQVDKKVNGGKKIKGLKTLELSEVEASAANKWRPRDGGMNMRQ